MESVDNYADEIFSNLDPEDRAVKGAREETVQKLEQLYEQVSKEMKDTDSAEDYRRKNKDERIMSQVKQRFGVQEAIQGMVKHQKLTQEYEEFMHGFSKKIRAGVCAILIIPIIFLMLMFTQDSKPVFLTLWIISILSIAAYLISMEYKKFEYEEQLGIREAKDEMADEEETTNVTTDEPDTKEKIPKERMPQQGREDI